MSIKTTPPLAAFNLWRFVGLRHLTEKPLRTSLTVLGVALGISLFLAIGLINQATLSALEENVRSVTGNAVLTVTAGESGFAESELARIQKVPGIKAAVPLVQARATVLAPGPSEALNVFGIDLLQEGAVRTYQGSDSAVPDFLTFLNQPDSIVITQSFAQNHRLAIGDKLRLMTASGPRDFVVRGQLSPQGPAKAYGGAIAIMDIDGARAMFGKNGKIDRVDLTASATADAAAIEGLKARLEKLLGSGFRILPPEGQSESMHHMIAAFQGFLAFISSLALLVGLFMVANTISVSVSEKRVEIGSLRALGATRRSILWLFLGEAAILGAVGGFLGSLIGVYFASHLGAGVARSMSQRFLTEIASPLIAFGWQDMARAVAIGAGVGALAAVLPASRAAGIAPIEAIRRSAESVQNETSGLLVRLFAFGCAALVALTGVLLWQKLGQPGQLEGLVQLLLILVVNLTVPLIAYSLFLVGKRLATQAEAPISRLALDNLLRSPKRTSGNILVLLVGLNLFVIISTVHHSFRISIADWLDRVLQADLVVAASGDIPTFQTQPLSDRILGALSRIPVVGSSLESAPRGLRFLHTTLEGNPVALKAYDPPSPSSGEIGFDLSKGDPRQVSRQIFIDPQASILISANLATRLKRKIGQTVRLQTPAGEVPFLVAGVVRDFTSGDGVVILGRNQYRRFWRDDLINLIYLRLRQGVDGEAVRTAIVGNLGNAGKLQILMNRELKEEVAEAVDKSFGYLDAIELAALTIALLALLNTLMVSVIERRRELGLLRAAGMSRAQLFALILGESAAQGLAAVFLALAVGAGISYLWINHSLETLLGWNVPFAFPIASALWAGVLGIGVCLLSAVYPAWRAAYLPITEAIAYD